jgi:translation elongation factor EF-1alpha
LFKATSDNGTNTLDVVDTTDRNTKWRFGRTLRGLDKLFKSLKDNKIKGFTLLEALEKFVKPPKRAPEAPLRIPISGVYNIKGVGAIITGRLEQGTAKVGDEIAFTPCAIGGCKMFSIEMHHKK